MESSFDFETLIAQARWYKEDLEKGGWSKQGNYPGFIAWTKSFPEEEVPVKVVFKFDLAMPPEYVLKMLDPSTFDTRPKWDDVFKDVQVLESKVHGEFVTYYRTAASWPVSSRSFVLLVSPIKEIDWCGKRCFIMFQKNAEHASKPLEEEECIRVYNGGNFLIAIPDDKEPTSKSQVFGLSTNIYNGWLPNWEYLHGKIILKSIGKLAEKMVKGYHMLYREKTKAQMRPEKGD